MNVSTIKAVLLARLTAAQEQARDAHATAKDAREREYSKDLSALDAQKKADRHELWGQVVGASVSLLNAAIGMSQVGVPSDGAKTVLSDLHAVGSSARAGTDLAFALTGTQQTEVMTLENEAKAEGREADAAMDARDEAEEAHAQTAQRLLNISRQYVSKPV